MIKRETDVEVVSKATTNQRIGRTNVQDLSSGGGGGVRFKCAKSATSIAQRHTLGAGY